MHSIRRVLFSEISCFPCYCRATHKHTHTHNINALLAKHFSYEGVYHASYDVLYYCAWHQSTHTHSVGLLFSVALSIVIICDAMQIILARGKIPRRVCVSVCVVLCCVMHANLLFGRMGEFSHIPEREHNVFTLIRKYVRQLQKNIIKVDFIRKFCSITVPRNPLPLFPLLNLPI